MDIFDKEELIKQLKDLTKSEMSHMAEEIPDYEEIDIIHKKRMEIWKQIGQINFDDKLNRPSCKGS